MRINSLTSTEFYNTTFTDLKLEKTEINAKTFENCIFERCNFNEVQFISCKFVDCEFKSCNLSLAQIKGTAFNDVVFDECKLIGINWTQAKWPYVKLTSSVKFYKSNISHSSFYALDLRELVVEECKAHEVDWREGIFSNGRFMGTDFEGSLFMHTNLYAANFIDALNYHINPNENNIQKGFYSMPEVINLLHSFKLEIHF